MSFKPLYILFVADAIVLIIAAKLIFKSANAFFKSVSDHFFPGDFLPNPFEGWAERTDARHKINLLYFVALALAGTNFLAYECFIKA